MVKAAFLVVSDGKEKRFFSKQQVKKKWYAKKQPICLLCVMEGWCFVLLPAGIPWDFRVLGGKESLGITGGKREGEGNKTDRVEESNSVHLGIRHFVILLPCPVREQYRYHLEWVYVYPDEGSDLRLIALTWFWHDL